MAGETCRTRRSAGPYVQVWSGKDLALTSDTHLVSLAGNGAQNLQLDAGKTHAGRPFLLLGSLSGTKPGLRIGPVTLPLNPDGYFWLTASFPNSPILPQSLGILDAAGTSTSRFQAVPQLSPALAGTRLDHAYLVLGANELFASNVVPLLFAK